MPVHVVWDDPDEKTVVRYELVQPWDWESFHSAVERGWKMALAEGRRTDIILDFSAAGRIPPDAIAHFSRVMRSRVDARAGSAIIIAGMGERYVFVIDVVSRLFPRLAPNIYRVPTVEEARAILFTVRRRRKQTIPA